MSSFPKTEDSTQLSIRGRAALPCPQTHRNPRMQKARYDWAVPGFALYSLWKPATSPKVASSRLTCDVGSWLAYDASCGQSFDVPYLFFSFPFFFPTPQSGDPLSDSSVSSEKWLAALTVKSMRQTKLYETAMLANRGGYQRGANRANAVPCCVQSIGEFPVNSVARLRSVQQM